MTRSKKSDITDKAKDTAEDLAEAAKASVTTKAETAKDVVSNHVAAEAASLRQAGATFEGNALASDAVAYLGDNLAQAASAVRDLDLSNIQQDVTQFARRNPLVFFGGAAALGFIAARALKASERSGTHAPQVDRQSYPTVTDQQTAHPDPNARTWGYS